MERERKAFREGVYRTCIVFDLGGFALKNMDYKFMKFMIHILQNYYPDTLGVALVLNSPWLFSGCWAILKRWIDPVSQKKVNFISYQQMGDFIDIDIIPKSFEGNDDWEFNPEEFLNESN